MPLNFRIRGRNDKYLLKLVAKKHIPKKIIDRKKFGFPIPLQDYLRPYANKALFENGFCRETLEISNTGIEKIVENWSQDVHAFFNLLALEIWGRLFVFRESVSTTAEFLSKLETKEFN